MENSNFKSGFVSMLGRTNVGKSSIINALVGEKVAAVANKTQTTRTAIRAIVNRPNSQIIFVDTPGIHKPKSKLGNVMVETAFGASLDVDIIVFVIDATSEEIGRGDRIILDKIIESKKKCILVINKIDLVDKLYSKEMLQGTEFYKKFKEAFKILDNIIDYDTSKKDAQHILRNIDNIDVIPKIIYDENLDLFDEYENEKEKKKKYELKRKIDKLFISINSKNKWKLNNFITECPYVKGKYIIDTKYDKEIGLLLEVDEGYSIDSREL